MSVDNLDSEGWSIDKTLLDYIRKHLPVGSTILELGSGYGTALLAEHYTMFSVEHDEKFLNLHKSTYLHVPLKEHKPLRNHLTTLWYNGDILKQKLKNIKYDLLLVDGPPQTRSGFFKYLDLFDTTAIMVFDDLHRDCDRKVINSVACRLKCAYTVYGNGEGKPFGVINDPNLREKIC